MLSAFKKLGRKVRHNSADHSESKIPKDSSNKENSCPSNIIEKPSRESREAENSVDRLLQNPDFVNRQYEELVRSRNPDQDVHKQMMSIKYETKVGMVRHQLRTSGQQSVTQTTAQTDALKRKRSSLDENANSRQKLAQRQGTGTKRAHTRSQSANIPTTVTRACIADSDHLVLPTIPQSHPVDSSTLTADNGSPQNQKEAIDGLVEVVLEMRDYASLRDRPDDQECTFEEPLRQLYLAVRCYDPALVKQFADRGLQPLMETTTSLAEKQFRSASDSKTLCAVIKLLTCLVQLPICDLKQPDFKPLFKALIEMKFSHGEARRGFSNFGKRLQVIDLMSAWVKNDMSVGDKTTQEERAKELLDLFKDTQETTQHDFINAMQQPRPYTRWFMELKKSTEGFGGVGWIWHNKGNALKLREPTIGLTHTSFYDEFKPVVGLRPHKTCTTVRSHTETEVTCYVAGTIDLLTTMVSSLSSQEERSEYRAMFRNSRFDELFLSRFLRASDKNFPIVHVSLASWYTAAQADGDYQR